MGRAVRPGGTVYAVDIDQGLLDHVEMEATERDGQRSPFWVVQVILRWRWTSISPMNDVLHHTKTVRLPCHLLPFI
jgi:hypothetical protein